MEIWLCMLHEAKLEDYIRFPHPHTPSFPLGERVVLPGTEP